MPHTHDVDVRGEVVRKTYTARADGEPEREWAALHHLARHAPDLAPAPIALERENHRPSVVMSRLSGQPLVETLTSQQRAALTTALTRLFSLPVPADLSVRANDPHRLQERFRPWLAEEYELHLCQEPGVVREAVQSARVWLDEHPPTADWLVDPVIALGDGNLDNVLWDGEVCRLIDWEEFGVSDLAYEVADVVEHASSRLQRRLDVQTCIDDLRLTADQRERMERHRRMFSCFWLAMLMPGNGGWHRNPPGSTEDQARHVMDLLG